MKRILILLSVFILSGCSVNNKNQKEYIMEKIVKGICLSHGYDLYSYECDLYNNGGNCYINNTKLYYKCGSSVKTGTVTSR